MKFSEYDTVYFLGIGGIGMSALARWFNHQGFKVHGYDRYKSPLIEELIKEGMKVTFDEQVNALPTKVLEQPEACLVVYTPAIPTDHPQWVYFKEKKFSLMKRSQVLGDLTKGYFTIAVAGTHGKTSTSALISHILKSSGQNVTAFVGGHMLNYRGNFIPEDKGQEAPICVVEADEYDRSFLTLRPNIAVLISVDSDHSDIYPDRESMEKGFGDFIGRVEPGGHLVVHQSLDLQFSVYLQPEIEKWDYSLNEGEIRANNIRMEGGKCFFDYSGDQYLLRDCQLNIPGNHNIENALAAIKCCVLAGVDGPQIQAALKSYQGVSRRFEFIVNEAGKVFIDDYAHHPREVDAFLSSVKRLFPSQQLTAVFQPHLFSRTKDFHEAFGQSLSQADQVYLLDIYPAREKPMEGISSELILNSIAHEAKASVSKEELLCRIEQSNPELLVTIGAGDIGLMVPQIKEILRLSTSEQKCPTEI